MKDLSMKDAATADKATVEHDHPDPAFDTITSRLIRREALRRAALELATTTPIGLENALARISAEVTADAADARTHPAEGRIGDKCVSTPIKLPGKTKD